MSGNSDPASGSGDLAEISMEASKAPAQINWAQRDRENTMRAVAGILKMEGCIGQLDVTTTRVLDENATLNRMMTSLDEKLKSQNEAVRGVQQETELTEERRKRLEGSITENQQNIVNELNATRQNLQKFGEGQAVVNEKNAAAIEEIAGFLKKRFKIGDDSLGIDQIKEKIEKEEQIRTVRSEVKKMKIGKSMPKFKGVFPYLDEFETFEEWQICLNDWEASNVEAEQIHKIQFIREALRKRKNEKPNADLIYERFEREHKKLDSIANWDPNITDVLNSLYEKYYKLNDWERRKKWENIWKNVHHTIFPPGYTRVEAFEKIESLFHKAIAAHVQLDEVELAAAVLKTPYLIADKNLPSFIRQNGFSPDGIREFLMGSETGSRPHVGSKGVATLPVKRASSQQMEVPS